MVGYRSGGPLAGKRQANAGKHRLDENAGLLAFPGYLRDVLMTLMNSPLSIANQTFLTPSSATGGC